MKLRKLGDIMIDMEELLFELHCDHDLQHGEVLALVNAWQNIHVPESKEEYTEGGSPEFYYGPKNNSRR